jgi:hypothetical protein
MALDDPSAPTPYDSHAERIIHVPVATHTSRLPDTLF